MESRRRDIPLSSDELIVVRKLIAEYQYDEARSRFLGTTWKRGRAVIMVAAGVTVFAMQIITTVVLVSGAH